MAIVLVLSALALLSFMVVAILSMARTEDRSAKASAEITDVRGLAELPVQVVISQVRRATANLGTQYTWASQPGMIRVFSNVAGEGNSRAPLFEAFKLYSSDRMALQGTEFQPLREAEKLRGWEQLPPIFTDLNAPIPVRPIQKVAGSAPNATEQDVQLIYPILDPEAVGLVDGFEINQDTVPSATQSQPVPMPAAWLYVLRDGRLISPLSGDGQRASFQAGQATVANPIVGRIAFWTDDESCKLNLNTASEPAPWDPPSANSRTDHSYAEYQPVRNEYHRQSGHPAFTALSPVFRSFGKTAGSGGVATQSLDPVPDPVGISPVGRFGNNSGGDAERYKDYLDSNHQLLPRTADRITGDAQDRGSGHGTRTPTQPERLKGNRLYSSIDELLFDALRKPQVASGDGLAGGVTLKPEDVRRVRFFLTTRSSAPELNPFNRPKISLWPVQQPDNLKSDLDKRMCIGGAFAGQPYYWQRASAWENDSSPGSSQSVRADAALLRNSQIIGYLQALTEMPTPGYGSSLLSKYGALNRDHLLLSMFDSVRSGVNIENAREQDGNRRFQYLPPSVGNGSKPAIGEYSAVPMALASQDATVKSYGRFPTVTEFALVLVATEAEKNPAGSGPYVVDPNDPELAAKTTKIRAFIILEPFMPTVGQPASSPAVRYRIKGLENLTLGGVSLGFPTAGAQGPLTNRCTYSASSLSGTGQLGGNASAFNGLAAQFLTARGDPKLLGTDDETQFPFVSAEVTLSQAAEAGQKKQLVGGALTLEIHPGIGPVDDDSPLQRIELNFPTIEVPVPRMKLPVVAGNGDLRLISPRFALKAESGQSRQELIVKGDVVRSLELNAVGPSGGDYRILAALPQVSPIQGVPQEFFAPVWANAVNVSPNEREAHTLRSGAYIAGGQFGADWPGIGGRRGTQQVSGFLLPGGTPSPPESPFPIPAALPGLTGARNLQNRPGDWDNGPGLIEDGPYVSRSDFGNQAVERASQSFPTKSGSYFGRGGPFLSDLEGLTQAPLRQMSSAIAFGSLPTGVYGDPNSSDSKDLPRPWQTLLFCANPPSRQSAPGVALTPEDHFGFTQVPDHQWLEFFWMPVTEPRPLSVALATEGKVNLNHQIMPFTYIRRATAVHGALQGVRLTAFHQSATTDPASHPKTPNPSQPTALEFRYPINAFETLRGMDEDRFNQGDIFRSAAEICETFLVPKRFGEPDRPGTATVNSEHDYGTATATTGLTRAGMLEWWNGSGDRAGFQPTGDNTRESPYAQLYPRLCTRSNVYQVHYKVQFLRKSRSTAPEVWDEVKDKIAAEQRGSATFERYLDTTDTTQPDYVTDLNVIRAVDDEYRYRIIQRQPFTP